MISEQTRRCDLKTMTVAVEYLTAIQANPAARVDDLALAQILEFLRDMGLVFQGFTAERLHYTLRGVQKKPISSRRLEEILEQIRGNP